MYGSGKVLNEYYFPPAYRKENRSPGDLAGYEHGKQYFQTPGDIIVSFRRALFNVKESDIVMVKKL